LFNKLDCGSPMGMEDGKIPDSALKASSEVSAQKNAIQHKTTPSWQYYIPPCYAMPSQTV
jgi:hypothetical protein